MHITIDTNNITEQDRAVLAFVLSGETDPYAASLATKPAQAVSTDDGQTAESEKPKRTRRTKAQMEADKAAEQEQSKSETAEETASKDAPAEIPTDASTEADAATNGLGEFESVSIEQVTELATQLIQKDRSAMVDLLKQFGARRVSEIPESDLGKFAAEIRAKLA